MEEMMKELRGMPVTESLLLELQEKVNRLNEDGTTPKLTIIRVGAREDDLAYERGIQKRFAKVGAIAVTKELPLDVTQATLELEIQRVNAEETVHGILLFRPLPKHLDEKRVKNLIGSEKDVDCMSDMNYAHLFAGDRHGYPPCTPQAVIEMMKYYGVELTGSKVVVVGRSMVVGKPLAMLLLQENATVTICHTKTKNLIEECQNADIICACAGVANMIKKNYVKENQWIFDVGINVLDGKLCGDVDFDQLREMNLSCTPVPGGVGSVTTTVLLKHTIENACAKIK